MILKVKSSAQESVKDDFLFRPAPSPENRLQVMPDQVEMLLLLLLALALQKPDGPLLLRKLSEKDPFVLNAVTVDKR